MASQCFSLSRLKQDNRVNFIAAADSAGSGIETIVRTVIKKIQAAEKMQYRQCAFDVEYWQIA